MTDNELMNKLKEYEKFILDGIKNKSDEFVNKSESLNPQMDPLEKRVILDPVSSELTTLNVVKDNFYDFFPEIKNYSQKAKSVDGKVQVKLLEKLQGETSRTAVRLLSAVRIINNLSHKEHIREGHLINLYNQDEYARHMMLNYGKKTSELLHDYLRIRGFIE